MWLDRNNKTQSTQDWPVSNDTECTGLTRKKNTQSAQDWPEITRYRVHRTDQKEEHTEDTGLDMYKNTQSAQDWSGITRQ